MQLLSEERELSYKRLFIVSLLEKLIVVKNMKNTINPIFIILITLMLSLYPIKINALTHNWVGVPKSVYGEQVWDKNNVEKNKDGSIRVLSRYIPKIKNEITQEILYTMDINCHEKTFRDVAVGKKEFDEFKNTDAKWKYPNGDKLLMGIINQVCKLEEKI